MIQWRWCDEPNNWRDSEYVSVAEAEWAFAWVQAGYQRRYGTLHAGFPVCLREVRR